MAEALRTDIDALMAGGLGQWLAEQGAMRAGAREKAAWRWTLGTALLLPLLAFVWFAPVPGDWRLIVTLGGGIGVIVWGYQPIAAAKQAIKIGINSAIARSLGIAYQHDVEPGGEFEAAKAYGLVPGHDRSAFEDRWHGTLSGHAFDLYEAHLEERRGAGKNRHWETVFRGVIITMAFGRDLGATTLLQRAGQHRAFFGLGGNKASITLEGHRLERIDTVHPDFAAAFAAWSDDPVAARVLLHPSYVEHLLAIERAFGGKNLRALFRGGEVIVVLESGNLFESGDLDAESDRDRAAQAAEHIAALAGLALAINQNERGRVLNAAPLAAPLPAPRPAAGFGRRVR